MASAIYFFNFPLGFCTAELRGRATPRNFPLVQNGASSWIQKFMVRSFILNWTERIGQKFCLDQGGPVLDLDRTGSDQLQRRKDMSSNILRYIGANSLFVVHTTIYGHRFTGAPCTGTSSLYNYILSE